MRIDVNLNPSLNDVRIFICLFGLSNHCKLSGLIRNDLLVRPQKKMTDFKRQRYALWNHNVYFEISRTCSIKTLPFEDTNTAQSCLVYGNNYAK